MAAVSFGPLVLAADRFAVVAGILGFLLTSGFLARRVDERLENWSWFSLISAVVTARAGHVATHWPQFADGPFRALALWQGGFNWIAGALTIAVSLSFGLKSTRQRLWALAPIAVGLIAWIITAQLVGSTREITLPERDFTTLEGTQYALRPTGDKPVVINLWASWCPPCRREMPTLARVSAASDEVVFLFVNQSEPPETIERYLAEAGLELANVLLDPLGDLARHYGAPGLPATLFVDAGGKLIQAHLGEISLETLQSNLKKLSVER
ncbi:TlpA family protein disulfide reductase [Chelativorans sp. SCAU2101]|jgi:thiol-disulfide isomerase/thioredoxin|uniref:TlpA family protein disulfide reductase n=1 Tax=Chelativorans petroleitrophicus TaxID=2975484 RepID=A0A9X2XBC2_9HYPH|nr:TlpA disulfide reductase family protein [Chelativorans petroleitrophicus]MCT8992238.1 TlpA family protein disulfide reductase [Chelativorans petroleitrophicus]PZN83971.1 MAG: redoxin [Pseudomonadota bacterium]